MSKLNDAIKPWLLANGFKEIEELPEYISSYDWSYKYHDDKCFYVFFDWDYGYVNMRSNIGHYELDGANAEQVIAFFKEHGKVPEQQTKQTDISLGQQMWGYLLSIGFEEIDKYDKRLGNYQAVWECSIAKGNLCAFSYNSREDYIFLIDVSSDNYNLAHGASTDDDFDIYSVADLQAWLQDNGYLDDNDEEQMLNNTPKFRYDISLDVMDKLQQIQQQIDSLTNKSKHWKKRAKKAERKVKEMRKVVVS